MGLFSFSGENTEFDRFLERKRKESDTGKTTEVGKIDDELQIIKEYQESMGLSTFKEAYRAIQSLGADLRPYGLYAGIYLKQLSNMPNEFIDGQLKTAATEAERLGLPSEKDLQSLGSPDEWASALLGDTEAIGKMKNRFMMGFDQEADQLAYGLTDASEKTIDNQKTREVIKGMFSDNSLLSQQRRQELFDRDVKREALQAERKRNVAKAKEREQAWKGYYATPDESDASGYDVPFNVMGTVGETGPGYLAGTVTALLTKGKFQPSIGFGVNAGMENLKYREHEDVGEATIGTAAGALEFLPGIGPLLKNLNPVRKGQQLTNRLLYGKQGKAFTSKAGLDKKAADRQGNAFNLMTLGASEDVGLGKALIPGQDFSRDTLELPYSWVKDPGFVKDRIAKEQNQTPLVQVSEQLNKLYKSANNIYEKALGAIGPSKGELIKDNGFEGADALHPYAAAIRKHIAGKKEEFALLQEPWRKAYQKEGGIPVNQKLLDKQAKELLIDPTGSKELNKIVRGITGREAKYNKETTDRLNFLDEDTLKLNKQINTDVDAMPLKETEIKLELENNRILQERLSELNPGTTAYDAMNNRIAGSAHKINKLSTAHSKMKKRHTDNVAARNAHRYEVIDIEESGGKLDFSNLSANQLVTALETLNTQIYAKGSTLQGISEKGKQELKQWTGQARDHLRDLDPAFSVPYGKTKDLERAEIQMFNGDGKGDSIYGLGDALKEKTGKDIENLFFDSEGLNNMSKMGSWMNSSNPLYRSIVRQNIDSNFSPSTMSKEASNVNPSAFDFDRFADDTANIDWDDYRKLLPADTTMKDNIDFSGGLLSGIGSIKKGEKSQGRQGIDYLSGLSGVSSITGPKAIQDIQEQIAKKGDLFKYKERPLGDVTDMLFVRPGKRPYANYLKTTPTGIDYVSGAFRKFNPPESTPKILHSPANESAMFRKEQLKRRVDETGSELVVPVKQNEEGLDILLDPGYNWDLKDYYGN